MKNSNLSLRPTKFGMLYVSAAGFAVLIGCAYKNNLVNLLAFFMLSLAVACLIWTYNNLRNLEIESIEVEGAFAGSEFLVSALVLNTGKEPRFSLEMSVKGNKAKATYDQAQQIPAGGRLRMTASYPAAKRGKFLLDQVRVSSVFPLGFFEARLLSRKDIEYYIYPTPASGIEPTSLGEAAGAETDGKNSGEDFHGHRKFQAGDSQRHIDWKAYARGRSLLTKEFSGASERSHEILDWDAFKHPDTEFRLSVLARRIDELRNQNSTFTLRLPGKVIASGNGRQHAVRCWRELAVFNPEQKNLNNEALHVPA